MKVYANPFVSYLNRYTTVSPEHEAAFDEFITQAQPPSGELLRLRTKIEEFVRTRFADPYPPSIILTGNAGDGKTYLCRQFIQGFNGQSVIDWGDSVEWSIDKDTQILRVIKDLSEVGRESGIIILCDLEATLNETTPKTTFLIAANEGRLRALLNERGLEQLYQEVDRQLREGPDIANQHLIVLNLNLVTTSTYVLQAIEWLTDPVHWQNCQGCPAFNVCPIRFNATRLVKLHIALRLKLLYQILEYFGIHVTIRDMLIHLAYTLTGGLSCETIIRRSGLLGGDFHHYVYYENVWGSQADETFRLKVSVLHQLNRLNVGGYSLFEIDDFIVNGRHDDTDAQTEYEDLFTPSVDLNNQRFAQDRDSYLRGGATSPHPDEDHPFLRWLPHCRRKLFFEWRNTDQANRLVPFLFLPYYLRLLEGELGVLDRAKRDLVMGLNRAFSKLYITDQNYLFVTSQYPHAVEQPVPIVRIKISVDYIDLTTKDAQTESCDCDRLDLMLIIPPPPHVKGEPIMWRVDLLCFEYLMRLAQGGTYNILADECELVIRQLKDDLLTRFAANVEESGDERTAHISFFAPEHNRYLLRDLWVNDEGKIQG